MQGAGSKEDRELGREDLLLSWQECLSNPLDTVSLLEIGFFFQREARETEAQFCSLPVKNKPPPDRRLPGRSPRH
jgi:hypothetical protein